MRLVRDTGGGGQLTMSLHVIFRGLEVILSIHYERRYGGQLEVVKIIKM